MDDGRIKVDVQLVIIKSIIFELQKVHKNRNNAINVDLYL